MELERGCYFNEDIQIRTYKIDEVFSKRSKTIFLGQSVAYPETLCLIL